MATLTTLTTAEAATRLGIPVRTLQSLINRRELTATRIGRRWRIDPSEIDRYLRDQTSHHTPRGVA